MKNTIRFILTTLVIVTLGSISAFANNVHLIRDVDVTDGGTFAQACSKVAGLGNGDIIITLVGSATIRSTCVNPAGNIAPGQANKVVTGSIRIRAAEIKNGSVAFCVRTADPACQTARSCGCPNNNWDATIVDVEFNSLVLTVEQGGSIVLQVTVL